LSIFPRTKLPKLKNFRAIPKTAMTTPNENIIRKTVYDFERIIGQLAEIPAFFGLILNYLFFIIILETILRFFEFVFSFLNLEEPEEKRKKDED